jgi:hypothetical protein
VCEEGDAELVRIMLANHGVHAEIVPIGSRSKYSQMTVWVRDADYVRATALVNDMARRWRMPQRAHGAVDFVVKRVKRSSTFVGIAAATARCRSLGFSQDSYRLCYIRGPEGLLIGLAEQLG